MSRRCLASAACILSVLLIGCARAQPITAALAESLRRTPPPGAASLETPFTSVLWHTQLSAAQVRRITYADRLYVESDRATMYALNPDTGLVLWQRSLDAPTEGGPFSRDESIYLFCRGRMYVLDRDKGILAESWDLPLLPSSPGVLMGERLVVPAQNGTVYSTDADGNVLWVSSGLFVQHRPFVEDGVIYGVSDRGLAFALDAGSGRTLWRQQLGGKVFSTPAIGEKHFYVAADDFYVYGLARRDGSLRWKTPVEACAVLPMRLRAGQLYVPAGRRGLLALNPEDGSLLWTNEEVSEPVATAGTRLYALRPDSSLAVIEAADGRLASEVPTGSFPIMDKSCPEGTLHLATREGLVVALKLR